VFASVTSSSHPLRLFPRVNHLAPHVVLLLLLGVELPTLANDQNYDFNYQQQHAVEPEVVVLPGDELILTCTYENPSDERM